MTKYCDMFNTFKTLNFVVHTIILRLLIVFFLFCKNRRIEEKLDYIGSSHSWSHSLRLQWPNPEKEEEQKRNKTRIAKFVPFSHNFLSLLVPPIYISHLESKDIQHHLQPSPMIISCFRYFE